MDEERELLENTDNGLRPEDGDQTIGGIPIDELTDEDIELMAGDEDVLA